MSEDQVVEGEEVAGLTREMPVVDINTATAAELSRLPGIGDKLAARIVEYRQEHPFREPAEITQVKGVSKAIYAGFADLIAVGPEEPDLLAPSPDPGEWVEAVKAEALASVVEGAGRGEWIKVEVPAPEFEAEAPAPAIEVEVPAPGVEVEAPAPVVEEPQRRKRATVVQEVPPPPPSRTMPFPERERAGGVGWLGVLSVGLVSAIAGACLALLLLLAVNGTLEFGQAATVKDMQASDQQLNTQVDRLDDGLSQVQGQLDEMQGSLDALSNQLQVTQGGLDQLDKELAAAQTDLQATGQQVDRMSDSLKAVQSQVGAMETQLGTLKADINAVRQMARRFDAFLTGLRELLNQDQEPAPALTPLPPQTRSPLAPNPTAKPEFTVIPKKTPTPAPTP